VILLFHLSVGSRSNTMTTTKCLFTRSFEYSDNFTRGYSPINKEYRKAKLDIYSRLEHTYHTYFDHLLFTKMVETHKRRKI